MMYTAHPTAIIDDGAQIGPGTRIWHWVHICGGARIGAGCSFGQNAFIGNDVLIADNCKARAIERRAGEVSISPIPH
jgi:UDP-2-acetamido-3-amino-2,3-dideoxy-glucuronate N-acetyltransferase